MQGKISGINGITPIYNPFDFKKGKIRGLDDRKNRYSKLKKKQTKHPDKEIQKLNDDGYELELFSGYIPT